MIARIAILAASIATATATDYSMSYQMGGDFHCYINECGCPGSFAETWCSASTAMITASWCNEAEANCAVCQGSVCYDNDTDDSSSEGNECFIGNCGCPGSYLEGWCSLETAVIHSDWCKESKSNCEGHCSGKYCDISDYEEPEPTGTCVLSQCGCEYADSAARRLTDSSSDNSWCTVEIAHITSVWCNANSDNCGHCNGVYCE